MVRRAVSKKTGKLDLDIPHSPEVNLLLLVEVSEHRDTVEEEGTFYFRFNLSTHFFFVHSQKDVGSERTNNSSSRGDMLILVLNIISVRITVKVCIQF